MRNVGFYILFIIFSVFSFFALSGETQESFPISAQDVDPVGLQETLQSTDADEPLWLFAVEGVSPSSVVACSSQSPNSLGGRPSGECRSSYFSERFCSNFFRLREVCCRLNDRARKTRRRCDGYYIYMLRKIII